MIKRASAGFHDRPPSAFRRWATAVLTAVAVLSLAGSPGFTGEQATPPSLQAEGYALFVSGCAACHQLDGEGVAPVYPRLNQNPLVTGEDPRPFAFVVIHGRAGMPAFGSAFSTDELAAILSYVRSAWDNEAGDVAPEVIDEVRELVP